MKLNAGIITDNLQATKTFYVDQLGFGVTFENDWYLLLHTPGHSSEIAFLKPGLPSQAPIFQQAFNGTGVFLTVEMEDVDTWYETIKGKGVHIAVEMKDEAWGDRHFAVIDPNGIGIDFVRYQG
jgi:catechol 2,3-dioxygenase-like lactoylglutathione lyase family enzyme